MAGRISYRSRYWYPKILQESEEGSWRKEQLEQSLSTYIRQWQYHSFTPTDHSTRPSWPGPSFPSFTVTNQCNFPTPSNPSNMPNSTPSHQQTPSILKTRPLPSGPPLRNASKKYLACPPPNVLMSLIRSHHLSLQTPRNPPTHHKPTIILLDQSNKSPCLPSSIIHESTNFHLHRVLYTRSKSMMMVTIVKNGQHWRKKAGMRLGVVDGREWCEGGWEEGRDE